MATTTANLTLRKETGAEVYNVDVTLNGNWDKIDAAFSASSIASGGAQIALLRETAMTPTYTVSSKMVNLTPTYNNGAVTFPGVLFINLTDTASASGSLLADMQVGGSSKFSVRKDGLITGAGGLAITGNSTITGTLGGTTTLTATTLAGTLSTAAQPNVTSLGTLTSLTLGGALTVNDSSVTVNGATAAGQHTVQVNSGNAAADEARFLLSKPVVAWINRIRTGVGQTELQWDAGAVVMSLSTTGALALAGATAALSISGTTTPGITINDGTRTWRIGGLGSGIIGIVNDGVSASYQIGSAGNIAQIVTAGQQYDFYEGANRHLQFLPATDKFILGTANDTNLYRSAADTLKTDDSLVVGSGGAAATLLFNSGSANSATLTISGNGKDIRITNNYDTGTGKISLGAGGVNDLLTVNNAGNTEIAGTLKIGSRPAFAASDKYLVVDASGNVHVSALGPAS